MIISIQGKELHCGVFFLILQDFSNIPKVSGIDSEQAKMMSLSTMASVMAVCMEYSSHERQYLGVMIRDDAQIRVSLRALWFASI
jgi:hypothetical protein